MRTLEEMLAALRVDNPYYAQNVTMVHEAHALGRSEGFAEGVEAAAETARFLPDKLAIRTLRAPSPATVVDKDPPPPCGGWHCWQTPDRSGWVHPLSSGNTCSWLGTDRPPDMSAPSPKEDAPRCEACGGGGRGHCGFAGCDDAGCVPCPYCGGTGRSTTGGGR